MFITTIVLFLSMLIVPSAAVAHVKWFSPYSVEDTPVAIPQLLTTQMFWVFLGVITIVMILAAWLERASQASRLTESLNALTAGMRRRMDDMMRVGMGAFLVALWVMGSVILTPELETDINWISWLQLGMALLLFWRMTMPLTSLGIVFLWSFGASQYGLFHLLDYPIFLGIAMYLMIFTWPKGRFFPYRWDVLRWGAAITLMWASIEKLAYPEWSFPILEAKPLLTLGFSKHHFMILAGLAEFALAFALIWTPLIRRLSAIVLCALFTAAIILFGKVDAIGHLMIILILISIIIDDRSFRSHFKRVEFLVPLKYVSLVGFTVGFYGLQAAFYGDLVADTDVNNADIHIPSAEAEIQATHNETSIRLRATYPDPILKIWSERGDDGSWRLILYTENFILSNAQTSMIENMPIGHAHIYRGEQKLAAAYTPIVDLGTLDPGVHHLNVVLKSTNHRTLLGTNGPIEQEIVLEVPPGHHPIPR